MAGPICLYVSRARSLSLARPSPARGNGAEKERGREDTCTLLRDVGDDRYMKERMSRRRSRVIYIFRSSARQNSNAV